MNRVVCWFSAGAASAVATKLAMKQYGDVDIVRINTGSEHVDNERFTADCERWFGLPVAILTSDKYADTWEVWENRRAIVFPVGAPCTIELKKKVREGYQRPDDIHIFGYTADEQHRANRFLEQQPGVDARFPLIDAQLAKSECLAIIDRAGIALPAMYQLGYLNNNCIGCPKGGMGYWNMIRRDFPEVFDRMAKLERDIGHAVCGETIDSVKRPVWLDELAPDRGDIHSDPDMTCSLNCAVVEGELAA